MLTWYLMLAERLPLRESLAAADGWGGDAYVGFERGGDSCARIAYTGRTTAATRPRCTTTSVAGSPRHRARPPPSSGDELPAAVRVVRPRHVRRRRPRRVGEGGQPGGHAHLPGPGDPALRCACGGVALPGRAAGRRVPRRQAGRPEVRRRRPGGRRTGRPGRRRMPLTGSGVPPRRAVGGG